MIYYFVRILVCVPSVVLAIILVASLAVHLTIDSLVFDVRVQAILLAVFLSLSYWAWYINLGCSRVHYWLAAGWLSLILWALTASTLLAWADGDGPFARAGYGRNAPWWICFLAPYGLGIALRQPRVRAVRLRRAQLRGDWQGVVGGLADRSPFVRRSAARMLGEMGPDAVAALPELNKSRYDPSPRVRRAVAAAVERITPRPGAVAPPPAAVEADDNPYRSPVV